MDLTLLHFGTFTPNDKGAPKFIPDDPDFFRINCEGLIGKRVQIDIREARRSNPANSFYWVGIVKVFKDFFDREKTFGGVIDLDEVHQILKAKILGFKKKLLPDMEVIEVPASSSRLTVSEFSDYCERCIQWGVEFFSLTFPEKPTDK